MKKFISLGLAVLILAATTCAAYAANARYAHIRQFTFDGEVNATSVYGETYVVLGGSYSSETVITLERSSDGGRTYRNYRNLESKTSSKTYYSASGEASELSTYYDYRRKAEVYVYDEDGDEIDYAYDYIY